MKPSCLLSTRSGVIQIKKRPVTLSTETLLQSTLKVIRIQRENDVLCSQQTLLPGNRQVLCCGCSYTVPNTNPSNGSPSFKVRITRQLSVIFCTNEIKHCTVLSPVCYLLLAHQLIKQIKMTSFTPSHLFGLQRHSRRF